MLEDGPAAIMVTGFGTGLVVSVDAREVRPDCGTSGGTVLEDGPALVMITGFLAGAGLSVDAREVGPDCGTSGGLVSEDELAPIAVTGVFLLVDAGVPDRCASELTLMHLGDPKLRGAANGGLAAEAGPVPVCFCDSCCRVAANSSSMSNSLSIADALCVCGTSRRCCASELTPMRPGDPKLRGAANGGLAAEDGPALRSWLRASWQVPVYRDAREAGPDCGTSGGVVSAGKSASITLIGFVAGVFLLVGAGMPDRCARELIPIYLRDSERRGAGGGVALVVIVIDCVAGTFSLVDCKVDGLDCDTGGGVVLKSKLAPAISAGFAVVALLVFPAGVVGRVDFC